MWDWTMLMFLLLLFLFHDRLLVINNRVKSLTFLPRLLFEITINVAAAAADLFYFVQWIWHATHWVDHSCSRSLRPLNFLEGRQPQFLVSRSTSQLVIINSVKCIHPKSSFTLWNHRRVFFHDPWLFSHVAKNWKNRFHMFSIFGKSDCHSKLKIGV